MAAVAAMAAVAKVPDATMATAARRAPYLGRCASSPGRRVFGAHVFGAQQLWLHSIGLMGVTEVSMRAGWFLIAMGVLQAALLGPLHAQPVAAGTPPAVLLNAPGAASKPGTTAPRQRLALVVGIGKLGPRVVLESARRDSQAVAAALRVGGFEVLLREDVSGADLRSAFEDFRARLHTEGVGLIYITGLAAQVDGRNLLLPADMTLNDTTPAPALAAVLRAVGVPLQEAVDALAGGPQSPRLLLVDAAYRQPALARLAPPGLARPRLAPNSMVLLGQAPAALQELPSLPLLAAPMTAPTTARATAPATAPSTTPPTTSLTDTRDGAATRFARVVVDALGTPRITAPEALRAIRRAVVDSSRGLTLPWVAGDTEAREYLADAALLEAAAAAAGTAAVPPLLLPAPLTLLRLPAAGPTSQSRSNDFGHAEGDVFTYEVSDPRQDELLLTQTIAIDTVRPDGQLVANRGQMQLDAQGRTVSERDAEGQQRRYEPVQAWWWAGPKAGESRSTAFRETYTRANKTSGQIEWRGRSQVGEAQMLETEAGDFDVLPIKTTGTGVDTPSGGAPVTLSFTRTVGYAPKLGMPVAIEIEHDSADGKALKRERVDLVHAQTSRSTP